MSVSDIKEAADLANRYLDRLPNALRYCYASGCLSLLAGWLVKIGDAHTVQWLSLLVFGFFVIVGSLLYFIILRLRIRHYKKAYPIDQVGKSFAFVWTNPALYLIDGTNKQIR